MNERRTRYEKDYLLDARRNYGFLHERFCVCGRNWCKRWSVVECLYPSKLKEALTGLFLLTLILIFLFSPLNKSLSEISVGMHNWPVYSFSMNALGKRKGTRYISSLFLSVSMCYSVQQIGICCSVKLKVSSVIDFPQISLHQSSKFLAFWNQSQFYLHGRAVGSCLQKF